MGTLGERRCSICTHPQIKEIEEDIVNQVHKEIIQKKYGLSESAIYRHRTKHLPSSIARNIRDMGLEDMANLTSTERQSDAPAKAIAVQLKFLYSRALKTMESCDKEKKHSTSIQAQRQALSCLETFFKASEVLYKLSEGSRVDESANNIRTVILEALEGHEEAKHAVSEALGLAIAKGEL